MLLCQTRLDTAKSPIKNVHFLLPQTQLQLSGGLLKKYPAVSRLQMLKRQDPLSKLSSGSVTPPPSPLALNMKVRSYTCNIK